MFEIDKIKLLRSANLSNTFQKRNFIIMHNFYIETEGYFPDCALMHTRGMCNASRKNEENSLVY